MIKIRAYDGITNTPAMPLLARAWNEIGIEHPGALCGCPISWDDNAFVAVEIGADGAEILIGVLSWKKHAWNKSAFVNVGWVDPAHRRTGVYRLLWSALVERAVALNLCKVEGMTSIENNVMRAAAARLGRVESTVMLVYRLPVQSEDYTQGSADADRPA